MRNIDRRFRDQLLLGAIDDPGIRHGRGGVDDPDIKVGAGLRVWVPERWALVSPDVSVVTEAPKKNHTSASGLRGWWLLHQSGHVYGTPFELLHKYQSDGAQWQTPTYVPFLQE